MTSRVLAYDVRSLSQGICVRTASGQSVVSNRAQDILDFLVFPGPFVLPSTMRVGWSLDSLASAVVPLLPPVVGDRVRSSAHRGIWGPYRLFYIPGKMMAVSKVHNEAVFYALSQYYPGLPEPSHPSELQELADQLLSAFAAIGVPSVATLSSPVAAAEASGMLSEYLNTIPSVADTPDCFLEAHDYALECAQREWVSNYHIGHWDEGECFSYDIASAYPFEATRLFDLRDCFFTKSETALRSACYGFLRGRMTIYPESPYAFCSPVLVDRGDGILVNYVGAVDGCYPLDVVRFVERHGLGEFRLRDGWFVSPSSGVRPRRPFLPLMTHLYGKRSLSPTVSFVVKRVMNGVVGRLLQQREDGTYGDLYNPIYYSLIVNRVSLRVADFIIQHHITEDELVHVGIDGCKATRYIPLPSKAGMGQWRSAGSPAVLVLSPGRVYTADRRSGGLLYHLFTAMLRAHPASSRYTVNGVTLDLRALHAAQDRAFPEMPRSGAALLEGRYRSCPVFLTA